MLGWKHVSELFIMVDASNMRYVGAPFSGVQAMCCHHS